MGEWVTVWSSVAMDKNMKEKKNVCYCRNLGIQRGRICPAEEKRKYSDLSCPPEK